MFPIGMDRRCPRSYWRRSLGLTAAAAVLLFVGRVAVGNGVNSIRLAQVDWYTLEGMIAAEDSLWGSLTVTHSPSAEPTHLNVWIAGDSSDPVLVFGNVPLTAEEEELGETTLYFNLGMLGFEEGQDCSELLVWIETEPIAEGLQSLPRAAGPVWYPVEPDNMVLFDVDPDFPQRMAALGMSGFGVPPAPLIFGTTPVAASPAKKPTPKPVGATPRTLPVVKPTRPASCTAHAFAMNVYWLLTTYFPTVRPQTPPQILYTGFLAQGVNTNVIPGVSTPSYAGINTHWVNLKTRLLKNATSNCTKVKVWDTGGFLDHSTSFSEYGPDQGDAPDDVAGWLVSEFQSGEAIEYVYDFPVPGGNFDSGPFNSHCVAIESIAVEHATSLAIKYRDTLNHNRKGGVQSKMYKGTDGRWWTQVGAGFWATPIWFVSESPKPGCGVVPNK